MTTIGGNGRVSDGTQGLGFRYEAALLLAFRLHANQVKKGTSTPYVAHLLGVSSLVLEAGGDEDQAIAALLHDAVEDQGGAETHAAIEEMFGARVANIVEACSDRAEGTEERDIANWHERKEAYLRHLYHLEENADSLIVSLADKVYNARAILTDLTNYGPTIFKRFHHPSACQQWYYTGLAAASRAKATDPNLRMLSVDLDAAVKGIWGELERRPVVCQLDERTYPPVTEQSV